jgi:hypothetical protein
MVHICRVLIGGLLWHLADEFLRHDAAVESVLQGDQAGVRVQTHRIAGADGFAQFVGAEGAVWVIRHSPGGYASHGRRAALWVWRSVGGVGGVGSVLVVGVGANARMGGIEWRRGLSGGSIAWVCWLMCVGM